MRKKNTVLLKVSLLDSDQINFWLKIISLCVKLFFWKHYVWNY